MSEIFISFVFYLNIYFWFEFYEQQQKNLIKLSTPWNYFFFFFSHNAINFFFAHLILSSSHHKKLFKLLFISLYSFLFTIIYYFPCENECGKLFFLSFVFTCLLVQATKKNLLCFIHHQFHAKMQFWRFFFSFILINLNSFIFFTLLLFIMWKSSHHFHLLTLCCCYCCCSIDDNNASFVFEIF